MSKKPNQTDARRREPTSMSHQPSSGTPFFFFPSAAMPPVGNASTAQGSSGEPAAKAKQRSLVRSDGGGEAKWTMGRPVETEEHHFGVWIFPVGWAGLSYFVVIDYGPAYCAHVLLLAGVIWA